MTYDINNLDKFDERYSDIDKCSSVLITRDGTKPSENLKSFILQDRQEAYNAGRQSREEEIKKSFIEEFYKSGERWYNYMFDNEEEAKDALESVEEEWNDIIEAINKLKQ